MKIPSPTIIEAAGEPTKIIEEFFGRVNTETTDVSIARMTSPGGWSEPAQTPEFDEYTVVLKGSLHVVIDDQAIDVHEGESIHVPKGKRVQYSTPNPNGAEYIAVCVPAFSPETVHRED